MNLKKVPAYIPLIVLIGLAVFIDAPVIPQPAKVPCYVAPVPPNQNQKPAFYLNETEWMSRAALFWG